MGIELTDPTLIELEFETVEQAEEFTAMAEELNMTESEYVWWLFEKYGRRPA